MSAHRPSLSHTGTHDAHPHETHMNYAEAHRPISLLAPPMLYGKVLQLGLGIGWMSDKILTHGITELTTWENDEEVIAARDETDPRHTIRLGDALDAFDIV